jgi:hypothetical protein
MQASGHHPRVCGCCYGLPAPHARVAPLRVPGGNCRSGDQSPRVHGVHRVHVSKTTNRPEAGRDIARLACDAGHVAPSLDIITRRKAACRLGLSPMQRVVTGSTPPVTTRVLASETTVLGDIGVASLATVTGSRSACIGFSDATDWLPAIRLLEMLASRVERNAGLYAARKPRGACGPFYARGLPLPCRAARALIGKMRHRMPVVFSRRWPRCRAIPAD